MQKVSFRPSIMVAVRIVRDGGVSYTRSDPEETLEGVHQVASWKITKDVPDLVELKKADAIAAECRRMVASLCVRTSFGLIMPKDKTKELNEVWASVKEKIATGNQTLTRCSLRASCLRGEIETSDQEAADAMMGQLGEWFRDLNTAMRACDAQGIRDTIQAMRGADELLGPEQSRALQNAVEAARRAARVASAEVGKKGREIAQVVQEIDFSAIDLASVYFAETWPTAPIEDAHETQTADVEVDQIDDNAETVET